MKKLSIIALLICSILTVMLFGSCGSPTEKETDIAATTEEAVNSESTVTQSAAEDKGNAHLGPQKFVERTDQELVPSELKITDTPKSVNMKQGYTREILMRSQTKQMRLCQKRERLRRNIFPFSD